MDRIISKVDYEMHRLGQGDPKLALELWYRICKNNAIIKNAIKVININGESCFKAPAICHMILSNPWDIDKNIYESFVMTILKDNSLNKLSVFRNNTFLYLILLNGALGFDDLYLELAENGIRNKSEDKPFEMRKVYYKNISSTGDDVMYYKSEDLDISITEEEIIYHTNGKTFEVRSENNTAEIEDLVELVYLLPTLDNKIIDNIHSLNQLLLNEQRLLIK